MIGAITAGLFSSGGAPAATASYESIATYTVGAGGVSSIDFTSIPSTYKHLQVRVLTRGTSTVNAVCMRFNTDTTTANYNGHILYGDGSSAAATNPGTNPYMQIGSMPTSSAGANIFGASVMDILDYTSTNKYKTVRSLAGYDLNGSGYMVLWSGVWMKSPETITTVTLLPNAATGNFAQYSSFALYGIKG